MDLVICCNVIGHASQADGILRESCRILKPQGLLFFDVDSFSIAELIKRYLWTRDVCKDKILATGHAYRI